MIEVHLKYYWKSRDNSLFKADKRWFWKANLSGVNIESTRSYTRKADTKRGAERTLTRIFWDLKHSLLWRGSGYTAFAIDWKEEEQNNL